MRKYTVEDVVREFEESGELTYHATMVGDYKTNNREKKRIIKLFKYFERNREFGYQCIERLLESGSVVVKTDAASFCLALSYNVERAVSVLERIASEQSYGIFRFNAEMTLKVWRERGYLKIYQ